MQPYAQRAIRFSYRQGGTTPEIGRRNRVGLKLVIVIGALLVIALVLYFIMRGDAFGQQRMSEYERDLLGSCLGDRERAERLIALEVENAPSIDREEAARRALGALRRDLK